MVPAFPTVHIRNRRAILRNVSVVSRLTRAACAGFSGRLFGCCCKSVSTHLGRFNLCAMIRSALAAALSERDHGAWGLRSF
jgi:hypothetical protein